jgi:DUF2911 family protein
MILPTRRARVVRCISVALALIAAAPVAGRAEDTYTYVVRLGLDTLSLETVTRAPTQVRGEYIVRTPRNLHRTYVMDLAADGTVRRFELTTRPMGAPPGHGETRSGIEFLGDSATVTIPRGDSSVTTRVAAGAGAVPYLNGVMGIMDQIAWQARDGVGDSTRIAMVPTAGAVLRGTAVRTSADSLLLVVDTPVGRVPPFRIVRDPERRVVSFHGHGSVFQAEAERIAPVDLAAQALAFADRPIGALSTRDTVRATIGDGRLWLDYGRPILRGRRVFGDVVPWGIVWRTGANAATQFRTSHALRFGKLPLPAGLYSLWTLPTRRGWTLILNEQSGQWGTQYDARLDVLWAKMDVAELAQPVDKLTMSFESSGRDGRLVLEWDRTRASIPFRVER